MSSELETFRELVQIWARNPTLFVEQVFGVVSQRTWKSLGSPPEMERIEVWQEKALTALVFEKRISIKSGKGVGKSAFLAWSILWFICTRLEVKIPCTATSGHQLYDVLWEECKKWKDRIRLEFKPFLPLIITTDRIELEHVEQNFATARTARREQPEALQGFHAANVLLVVDEASGVFEEIFKAGEGTMSTKGAITLLTGNPTRLSGFFYECFHSDKARWYTMTVACHDSYMVTQDYIDGMEAKYRIDSNEYRVGVLGLFPLSEGNAIVPRNFVEMAVLRDVMDTRPIVWGLDVSRSLTGDFNSLAKRQGRVKLEKNMRWRSPNAMHTAGIVVDEFWRTPMDLRPAEIYVDVIGVGGPVYDRLREMGLPVKSINVTQKSYDRNYPRLMDELWFKCRDWFESMECRIPIDDDDFITEVSSVQYDFTSSGQRRIVDKHAGGHSPDDADAFVLTFASPLDKRVINPIARMLVPEYAIIDASYADGGTQWE